MVISGLQRMQWESSRREHIFNRIQRFGAKF